MSFPRYPSYKDSGVEWLGEVPEHWEVRPCRVIVHERTVKNEGAECQDYLSLMANVGIIPYAEKGDVGNKKPEDLSKCKMVTRGDFVINSMNYGIGSYGLSDYDGVCSPVYIVLKPQNDVVEPRFAFRIFENRAFQTFAQSFGNGILEHRCAINWDILKPIGVGVPPMVEQKAILAFLDRETAKIDGLVVEQRRLMELLKEKRQAVISHAVTQGLNPHAPMKPSGIEWLGDVPAHWAVTPIGHLCDLLSYGFTNPMPTTDEGPYLLTANDVDYGKVRYETARRTSYDSYLNDVTEKSRPKKGDVLITKDGTLGRVAVHEGQEACINQSVALLRVKADSVSSAFMATCLLGGLYQDRMIYDAGGTTIKHIYISRLAKMPIAYPSISEQEAVLAFLSGELTKFDTLITDAKRAIDLLQERRTALISAVVTGQIDVRGAAQ